MTDNIMNMDKVRFLTNPEANSVYIVQGRFSIGAGRPFILGAPMDQKCSFYIKLNGFMTRSRLPYSSIVVGLAEGNALTTIGASGFIDHAPHMQAMLAK